MKQTLTVSEGVKMQNPWRMTKTASQGVTDWRQKQKSSRGKGTQTLKSYLATQQQF